MSEKKFEINNVNAGQEIVIREGSAQEITVPRRILITGTLKAPFQFLERKFSGEDVSEMGTQVPLTLTEENKIYNVNRSHLLVDKAAGTLVLVLNEKDEYMDVITGKLTLDPTWNEFKINQEKMLNLNEVIKLIKRNKFKFADAAKHGEFLVNLQNFNARVTTTFKNARDNSGSSIDMVEKVVAENKNAPEFVLNVPIYQGYEKKSFRVQTCLDASGQTVMFYFESVELYELIDSERERAINEELEKFRLNFPCSIVEVA